MTARDAKKKAGKSVKKTGRKTGTLVPQKHGGAILNGMAPNHVPGPGRPPDALEARLRELGYNHAAPLLEKILKGEVPVSLLGKCDACGHDQPISQELLEHWKERAGVAIDQQLKASEQALKYSKADKELSITNANAAEFFEVVTAAAVDLFGVEGAEALKARALSLMEGSKA